MQIRSEDLSVGSGAQASFWQTLRFHYTIRDPDGLIADQTDEQPFVFSLLPDHTGWIRHLVGMRVGGRRRLRVPSGSDRLIIDVHLVSIDNERIVAQTRDALLGDGPAARWGDIAYVQIVKAPLSDDTRPPPRRHLSPPSVRILGACGPLDEVIVGMRPGGMRHVRRAALHDDDAPRFVWIRLVALQPVTPAQS